jgi:hypothetical protein
MALTITDQVILASGTRHAATASDGTGWTVTWLPGQNLTRSQAITAMLIAQAAARGAAAGRGRAHVDAWAAELGLTGPAAVSLATQDWESTPCPHGERRRLWAVRRAR